MTTPKAALTARDVVQLLRDHYIRSGQPTPGAFLDEIESPCGSRRADALWIPTTASGGRVLVGHEVKVSRSDLLVELSDPTKADPWLQYCDYWWLVVADPAFVAGLSIPETWGILAPPSGRLKRSMTVLRPAPRLIPKDQAAAFHRVLAWTIAKTDRQVEDARWKARSLERKVEALEAERNSREIRAVLGNSPHAERVSRIIKAADERLSKRDMPWWANGATDDEIVPAIVDHVLTRRSAQHVRTDMERILAKLHEQYDPVRAAEKSFRDALRAMVSAMPSQEGGAS